MKVETILERAKQKSAYERQDYLFEKMMLITTRNDVNSVKKLIDQIDIRRMNDRNYYTPNFFDVLAGSSVEVQNIYLDYFEKRVHDFESIGNFFPVSFLMHKGGLDSEIKKRCMDIGVAHAESFPRFISAGESLEKIERLFCEKEYHDFTVNLVLKGAIPYDAVLRSKSNFFDRLPYSMLECHENLSPDAVVNSISDIRAAFFYLLKKEEKKGGSIPGKDRRIKMLEPVVKKTINPAKAKKLRGAFEAGEIDEKWRDVVLNVTDDLSRQTKECLGVKYGSMEAVRFIVHDSFLKNYPGDEECIEIIHHFITKNKPKLSNDHMKKWLFSVADQGQIDNVVSSVLMRNFYSVLDMESVNMLIDSISINEKKKLLTTLLNASSKYAMPDKRVVKKLFHGLSLDEKNAMRAPNGEQNVEWWDKLLSNSAKKELRKELGKKSGKKTTSPPKRKM